MNVFDAHAHLAPGAAALDRLLAVMDECGITRAVVVAGATVDPLVLSRQLVLGGESRSDVDNDATLAACRRSDGRLVPFFFANPHSGPGHYQRADTDFRGLKLAPGLHGVGLLDERVRSLVAVAADRGHPIYLHCLDRPGFRVADLVALATAYPSAQFILGHGGVGDLDFFGVELIEPYANILFETSGGYTSVAGAALRRLGARRVLFGTEYPLQHPNVELAKFRALGLTDEIWKEVAWRNIRRLLGENGM